MPLYGGSLDAAYIRRINKEYIHRVVSQEVIYYKISLEDTVTNIYGEAKNKVYYSPVLVACLVTRNPQTNQDEDYGNTTDRQIDFAFIKTDLAEIELVPEKGDIIVWNESFFEVDNVVEDQLTVGKDPNYGISKGTNTYGQSLSIICNTHLTRISKLNIVESR